MRFFCLRKALHFELSQILFELDVVIKFFILFLSTFQTEKLMKTRKESIV